MNRRQLKVRRKGQARCPLCRVGLRPEDPDQYTCEECDTTYHGDCAQELGGCATLGCARMGVRPGQPTPAHESRRERNRRRATAISERRRGRRELREQHVGEGSATWGVTGEVLWAVIELVCWIFLGLLS